MHSDIRTTEDFDVHQTVEIGYYGESLPAIKVLLYRTDQGDKPYFCLGETVCNPIDRRSLENHAYAIEPPGRQGEDKLGGIYIRLTGESVGLGEESTIEKTHYAPEAQKQKKK